MDYGVSELCSVELKTKRLRSKDWVEFQCVGCGECCRHLSEKVMVESLDAFRLARYLRDHGQPHMTVEEFYTRYTTPVPFARGYPIFTMNTAGNEESCVFLKDGRCSVYPARTRACRLYPFSVGPGERGQDFEWYQCLDASHHFSGSKVQVKDWFYQHFSREDREYVKREADACRIIGAFLAKMDFPAYQRALPIMILLRYHDFDLDQPFLPQYDHNLQVLLKHMERLLEEGGGQ